MKINKRNPEHLTALFISAAYSCVAVGARPFIKKNRNADKVVVFYGHTLNGNLKAFYDYLNSKKGYKAYFLVLDKHYLKRLKRKAANPDLILSALSIKDMLMVARADAFITSHGLHMFSILRLFTNIKFIDVWHAVSYKGFAKRAFRHLWRHHQTWVSSDAMKNLYIERYGFEPSRVKVTGYARTDQLVNGSLDKDEILKKYSIPKYNKYILIAPTWHQDHSGRSLVPFGVEESKFFKDLDQLATKNSACIIFRTHLNSGDAVSVKGLRHIKFMPYSKYEVVEDFLFMADILVTDWSSIGIDYLPLRRPAIFLDVPAPFKHGFNLGPEHRYGDIASSFNELKALLEKNLKNPKDFAKKHSKDMDTTTLVGYGNTLDGKSVERYYRQLTKLV